ncbi:MAG: UDP-N-acetylglucosamine 2-epimerase (hydrolyzing) [Verrucomicrobia bacterium]|nr:UDP-N-acetylglucosamine 2-epimerase (hydrolyzing) [Verrucomicrobiota bacterium]
MTPRKICVVTAARSEYGAARWLMKAVQQHPALRLQVLVTGAHFAPVFGRTITELEADGFSIDACVDLGPDWEQPGRLHHVLGACLAGVGEALTRLKPDILVVFGDRHELLPICTAATLAGTPLAHVSGGDITEGAADDAIRHAVTKLAHLHFPAHAQAAEVIRNLGEAPDRIRVVGELSLAAFYRTKGHTRQELAEMLGLNPALRWVLFAYHPVTLAAAEVWLPPLIHTLAILEETEGVETLLTYPNADPGNELIRDLLERRRAARPDRFKLTPSLGPSRFVSFLKQAWLMIGNSSSALIEAPSAHLAAINLGDRQKGRLRGQNIIDAAGDPASIRGALELASSLEFRNRLERVCNPYGDGVAAERVADALATVDLREIRRKPPVIA